MKGACARAARLSRSARSSTGCQNGRDRRRGLEAAAQSTRSSRKGERQETVPAGRALLRHPGSNLRAPPTRTESWPSRRTPPSRPQSACPHLLLFTRVSTAQATATWTPPGGIGSRISAPAGRPRQLRSQLPRGHDDPTLDRPRSGLRAAMTVLGCGDCATPAAGIGNREQVNVSMPPCSRIR